MANKRKEILKSAGREWLNEDFSHAHVMWTSELHSYTGEDNISLHFNADIDIADCHRQISLEFYVRHIDDVKDKLDKIGKLKAAIADVEKGLLKYVKEWEKIPLEKRTAKDKYEDY